MGTLRFASDFESRISDSEMFYGSAWKSEIRNPKSEIENNVL
jgi:hypothetical protein